MHLQRRALAGDLLGSSATVRVGSIFLDSQSPVTSHLDRAWSPTQSNSVWSTTRPHGQSVATYGG